MNEHDDRSELPELSDDDVRLLHAICLRASPSRDPPFKALFAAYDAEFAEQGLEQEHDGVVFRYLMRIGESTRAANRERRPVDLLERLRSALEARGITLVTENEDGSEEVTGAVVQPPMIKSRVPKRPGRRVSFEDANLEETWLSEHWQSLNPIPPRQAPSSLLSVPPRRGRGTTPSGRRARSTSVQRDYLIRNAAPKDFQRPLSSPDYSTEPEHPIPDLLFDPSHTQLEQNAEAFLSTSAIRVGRHILRAWHTSALHLQHSRSQANSTAVAHDRRTLLKQALDQWRGTTEAVLQEKHREARFSRLEDRTRECRDQYLLSKAFNHWATSSSDEKLATRVAFHHVLRVTYFKRWRAIASENQMKIRRILVRKYLGVWRGMTARRQLWQEQAAAHYEETLLRKCKSQWFWEFCSRRVEGWHEVWIQRRAMKRLSIVWESRQGSQQQAVNAHQHRAARRLLHGLQNRLQTAQQGNLTAQHHRSRNLYSSALEAWSVRAKLAPLERKLRQQIEMRLERKALNVWHFHLSLIRQAEDVDKKRILQATWTSWNDALRCLVLAQKIDQRVLVENLYKWVLQERLKLFRRTSNTRLAVRVIALWKDKASNVVRTLEDAERAFIEAQRRSRLASAMRRLNAEMRKIEDAERAGLEFRNAQALPKILEVWRQKTGHIKELAKWAARGRFYCLCSPTLKVWREKMSQHRQGRRRDAYAHIRARVKIRLAAQSFTRWRSKFLEVKSMEGEAERRLQVKAADSASRCFGRWTTQTTHYAELTVQAVNMDHRKLLTSVLGALSSRYQSVVEMDQRAQDFGRETNLSLVAGALKRIQWAMFMAARNADGAEKLWAKNRDLHVRQMLRHWAAQTATRKRIPVEDVDEQESPSLRPASRAASRTRSVDRGRASSPTGAAPSATPAYLRTPSRSRRAGRFRPLPTPAIVTPMAFDSGFLAEASAPLSPTTAAAAGESRFEVEDGDQRASSRIHVTPFARKLRAGGIVSSKAPPSALRKSTMGQSTQGGTGKSVRFVGGSRFGHLKDS